MITVVFLAAIAFTGFCWNEQLQVLPRTDGNTYIADILNAQLRLPRSNTFRQNNPIEGITMVTVANQANSIRVTVTGSSGVPTVELFDSDEGLIFGLTPVASSTETQEPPKDLSCLHHKIL